MTLVNTSHPSALDQLVGLSGQTVRRTLHDPAAVTVAMLFPLVILAINVAALHAAPQIPGFPTSNVVDFVIPLTFLQGALFAAIASATELAIDIESGFLTRVALAPVRASVLLTARLAGVLLMSLVQAAVYLAALVAAGGDIATGVDGVAVLVGLSVLSNLALASVAFVFALTSGSGEAVQSLFPVFFVFLLLSSALMPRDLINADWFRVVADVNPVSYVVEALRSLVVDGWNATALLRGGGTVLVIILLFGGASVSLLRRRMVRP